MSAQLLEMLDLNARTLAVDAITNAIAVSFAHDQSRQTQSEVKRRFNLCLGLVGAMRNELGWSWQRITDMLSSALRDKLDNGDWTPPSRHAWMTDGKTGLILPPGVR